MALAAVLEGREEYRVVDGNLDENPTATILDLMRQYKVELLGVSVMPGPQMVAAMTSCKVIRSQHPKLPIVWGGYFPSIYSDSVLNARYVDYVVRGQGADTLLELIDAMRGARPFEGILGLSYKDMFGLHKHNPERLMKPPDAFPWSPFHRVPVEKYLRPSFFGKRTTSHHASIGCPISLQLLRDPCRVWKSRIDGEPSADCGDPAAPENGIRSRFNPVLRHELFSAREPRRRTYGAHGAARYEMVVRGARRHVQ
jgi:hypothetical protein